MAEPQGHGIADRIEVGSDDMHAGLRRTENFVILLRELPAGARLQQLLLDATIALQGARQVDVHAGAGH